MVTARHVINAIQRRGSPVFVRVNTADGFEWLQFDADDWALHPSGDELVDVAVHPLVQVEGVLFDILAWPDDRTTDAIEGVGPGDELFMTGLFVFQQGLQGSKPIVRVGNIAAMPAIPSTPDLAT
jgi:hypothetical protein